MKVTESVDFIDLKQRSDENGTLELLYNFRCEIYLQQKIYLSDAEMYICGVPKWEVTSSRKEKLIEEM